ncbi:MAG: MGMT family protein [Bacteroidetes bacterium]|nr:MGMT family protein [Bacteroidota bacterium]MBP6314235.1 MGMT family protein [Chitinophagaceae bacterium]
MSTIDEKSTNWIEKVYAMVRQIPRGKVTNYGTIADHIGVKATSRMVGWAMNASHAATPKVPAHRVVNRNGVLTGKHHFATPTLMQDLLEAEGIQIIDDKIVDFKKHFWQPS